MHTDIFVIYLSNSLFWRKKFLVSLRIKHPDPTIIFFSSPPNQRPFKKFSFLLFLSLSFLKSTLSNTLFSVFNRKIQDLNLSSPIITIILFKLLFIFHVNKIRVFKLLFVFHVNKIWAIGLVARSREAC